MQRADKKDETVRVERKNRRTRSWGPQRKADGSLAMLMMSRGTSKNPEVGAALSRQLFVVEQELDRTLTHRRSPKSQHKPRSALDHDLHLAFSSALEGQEKSSPRQMTLPTGSNGHAHFQSPSQSQFQSRAATSARSRERSAAFTRQRMFTERNLLFTKSSRETPTPRYRSVHGTSPRNKVCQTERAYCRRLPTSVSRARPRVGPQVPSKASLERDFARRTASERTRPNFGVSHNTIAKEKQLAKRLLDGCRAQLIDEKERLFAEQVRSREDFLAKLDTCIVDMGRIQKSSTSNASTSDPTMRGYATTKEEEEVPIAQRMAREERMKTPSKFQRGFQQELEMRRTYAECLTALDPSEETKRLLASGKYTSQQGEELRERTAGIMKSLNDNYNHRLAELLEDARINLNQLATSHDDLAEKKSPSNWEGSNEAISQLFYAVKHGNKDTVAALLKAHPTLVSEEDRVFSIALRCHS